MARSTSAWRPAGVHRRPRVQLLEFGDFECPFCRAFHQQVKQLRSHYPNDVALYYVHYPLPTQQFAESAATAADCAAEQGRFEQMHDRLFERQSEPGRQPWNSFAREAGIQNLEAFAVCIESERTATRIIDGRQLGDRLGIQGVPMIVINGWKLGVPPDAKELERMGRAILADGSPVPAE